MRRLQHCTAPWTAPTERRTCFAKYAPFGCHHLDVGYAAADAPAGAAAREGWTVRRTSAGLLPEFLTQLDILLAAQEEQLAMVSMPAVWLNEPSPSPLRHDHVRRYAHSAGDDPLPWDSAPARL